MVFEFAETGALAKAERDAAQRSVARKKLDAFEQRLVAGGPFRYAGSVQFGYPLVALEDVSEVVPDQD